ncbi:alpha/beta hydrolase [Listeria booriae]|uniref:Esterase family protein n=1 Tax=Listeria booriae TaxID=1552123 RepID=A0A099WK71_9LIST|nr:esterase family protein [Listeria booriae]KGL44535.1 hypothetical protein EP57_00840 [Listeria booriae]MBC1210491.1 esterase family protein [Listeria booriae]MBC1359580.1 esterase family protein [Listeria booriae]MBC1559257.1 esterase family protein [Listeria booriae]MBC1562379.1 esterase family protein [Listeria booriae]
MTEAKMLEKKIWSNVLNEELDLLIYLPPTFSPLSKYPFFLVQDGKDYFQFGKLARFADELVDDKTIQEAIFVGIPYKTVEDRREKYHPDGPQNEAYIRFLAHELVPYIEDNFPTYHMGASRFLMGDSLGASVSLKAALKYPHAFGNVILHSPLVTDALMELAEKADPALTKIFHVVGNGETEVETTDNKVANFLEPNLELHELFQNRGFDYYFQEFEGGHRWKYWQPFVKEALQFMLDKEQFATENMSV